MKKFFLPLLTLVGTFVSAQYVGINTSTPKSTLDVTAKNPASEVETQIDGVLVARVSKARAEAMGTNVPNGNLIFVDNLSSPTTITTTTRVIDLGFYYYDSQQSLWIPARGNDWHTTGNKGTEAGTNFLGTTDNTSLMFKVNDVKSGWISNTTDSNTGIGYNTLTGSSFSTAGSALNNVALGKNTLANANSAFTWSNIAIGNNVLKNATDPRYNTAIGDNSQSSLTTGRNNVSLGVSTLANATTGGLNTAIGGSSMGNLTTGAANNALGLSTLSALTTGHANIALGQLSGSNLVNGSYNTIIGNYNNILFNPNGNQQLNIGDLIYGTGLSTCVYAVVAGTTSYSQKRIGIAVTAQPTSTLEVNGSFAAKIRSMASGTVANNDYTILVQGDISLPNPDATNTGRVYHLISDVPSNTTITIPNYRESGTTTASIAYVLSNGTGRQGVTIQSTGSAWVIIGRY